MTRLIAICLLVLASRAHAEVARYAMIIGNNAGDDDEPRLRYAEDDARRVHDVLRELGGFSPENMLLLRGEDAETVRRGLIALNDRIRTQTSPSELVVYYSGHADAGALHLGRSALDLPQLEQLVRGSAATLRVLVLDSCRSGALTRVKGGTIEPGFAVAIDAQMPSDGVVFWTASSASENAQESDALRGSFFTHYLVSGLLGAADLDGNGEVTLGEAYRHSYDNTLRATSRTLSGTQHPTFHYELAGHADVVLTTLVQPGGRRAQISFPEGTAYLLIADHAEGDVVAEVGAHDRVRRLSVKAGRYFVRGRGAEYLLEGSVTARAGEQVVIRAQDLERIAYARLVRKGREAPSAAISLQAGYALRSGLWDRNELCQGPFAGAAIDLRVVTVAPRVAYCGGQFNNIYRHAGTSEVTAELRGAHVWDVRRAAISVGVSLGGSVLRQDFANDGIAADRSALAAHLGVLAGVTVELVQGFYGGLEVDAMTYFFNQQSLDERALRAAFALRFDVLLLGKHW